MDVENEIKQIEDHVWGESKDPTRHSDSPKMSKAEQKVVNRHIDFRELIRAKNNHQHRPYDPISVPKHSRSKSVHRETQLHLTAQALIDLGQLTSQAALFG